MAIPASARGQILDAQRLLAFDFDTPVNVLVLFDEQGRELLRIDHWWTIRESRTGKQNEDKTTLRIVEDDQALDGVLAAADSMAYIVEPTMTTGDKWQIRVADKPAAGKLREWSLSVNKTKFKSKFFGTGR